MAIQHMDCHNQHSVEYGELKMKNCCDKCQGKLTPFPSTSGKMYFLCEKCGLQNVGESIKPIYIETDLQAMESILAERGYNSKHAKALQDEGMGFYELEGRLKEKDGLERTHGIKKIGAAK